MTLIKIGIPSSISPKRVKLKTSNLVQFHVGNFSKTNKEKSTKGVTCDPLNFGALNANGSNTVKGMDFKLTSVFPGTVERRLLKFSKKGIACGQGHVSP